MTELKEIGDELKKMQGTFHQFKEANDLRIAEEKKRGDADVLLKEKVDRIATKMEETERKADDAFKEMQLKMQRIAKLGSSTEQTESEDAVAHRKAFLGFLRKGEADALPELQQKAMLVGSQPDGGYLVPTAMSNRIVERLRAFSPMRQFATIENVSTDALEILKDVGDADCSWVSETATRSDTTTPTLGKARIPVHELAAQPKATQKLIDDASVNIEEWLVRKIADRMARKEANAFVAGDGVTKPRGITTYSSSTTGDATRTAGTFQHVGTGSSGAWGTDPNGADKLIDLVHTINPGFLQGAVFAGTRSTIGAARKLKDTDGNYVFLPSFVAGVAPTILGYNVAYFDDMDEIAANTLSLMFGNIKEAYTIVDRMDVTMLRDPFTDKPNVKFYTVKRVGGDVVNFDAVKFLKFA